MKANKSNKNSNKTVNKSGVPAFKMKSKEKLVVMVFTTMFNEDKFYGDNTKELLQVAKQLIEQGEGQFVCNLAIYARKEMMLRSVSHALTALLANCIESKAYVSNAVSGVVERADDITEILANYLNTYSKPVPNSLKKALGNAMNTMNEYDFAKYNHSKASVKFKDVLNICHVRPKNENQSNIFKAILQDNLLVPYTWETELSSKGNNKETWQQLIDSGKVGYMALLRNLRNILNAGVDNLDKVLHILSDKDNVLKSKQLPFRYYSAYNQIVRCPTATSQVFQTLEKAIEHSVSLIEKLPGTTLVAIDVSGSMTYSLSLRSRITPANIACLCGAMASKICDNSIVVAFDSKLQKLAFSATNGIIANANSIDVSGSSTDITLPLQYILENKIKVDRIILFSDNEINSGWQSSFSSVPCQKIADKYRKKVNPDVWIHAVDIAGYGTQQFCGKNTNIIAGWNEKIFEFIHLAEKGFGNIVDIITNYVPQ